jgi:SpoVK/Ycf46/Vps4 family AAA+-type ATPase
MSIKAPTPTILPVRRTVQLLASKRFLRVVAIHILKNNLKRAKIQVPLLMGIHGPTGEGKTFQCENILKYIGVKRFLISGGQLDNPVAGQSASLVRSTYIRASDAIRSGECSLAVVLINDIDTGLGRWGESAQYTANQVAVFGELMHLVDYPGMVESKETVRVPIVITGNDFTKLYEPLVRAGRMAAFEWIPNLEEKVEVLTWIFPEMTAEECKRLVLELREVVKAELPDQPDPSIAFYAHLRANMLDEDLWREVETTGLDKTVDNLLRGVEPDFSLGIRYDRVFNEGIDLIRSGKLISHLVARTKKV